MVEELVKNGLDKNRAELLTLQLEQAIKELPPQQAWQKISTELLTHQDPFAVHLYLYTHLYPNWETQPCPAWFPSAENITHANISQCMRELKITDYREFHQWSVTNHTDFIAMLIDKIGVKFSTPYKKILDLSAGIEKPVWFADAQLNCVDSCFLADADKVAIVHQNENGPLKQMTYGELDKLSNRVANSLQKQGLKAGDAVAIDMLMTAECAAIYLGIIKAGCVVVSIADSFAPDEIATRLRITQAKAIFTQDVILRTGKTLPLYQKVVTANAPLTIVLPANGNLAEKLRPDDLSWAEFLVTNDQFDTVQCSPQTHINILFSSGTTGDPKAIPWNHSTATKCAMDSYLHHDLKKQDVVAWPTNIGWMMGPWLIFAGLMNQATIALFAGAPVGKTFGEFIQNAKVTVLGLVPSIVKAWRTSACMEDLNWKSIKLFSSTGECSNVEDMLYLMWLANYQPIIEYCGGTEIGGAYITSTIIHASAPAAFTTPTLGLDFIIINDHGLITDNGEVALIPPAIGLSTELLNKDHYKVYFADMPSASNGKTLRRHGDQIQKFANAYYRALGRVDDTMNLGGIKTSSAEIERILLEVENVLETAAIAINPPGGGPSLLVIYLVAQDKSIVEIHDIKIDMQKILSQKLNPLFKIHDVVLVDSLPRTASNKVMRRVLRDEYQVTHH